MNPRLLAVWILFVALLLPVSTEACSCAWAGPFLTVAPRAELVIRARVIAHREPARTMDLAMDVEVLEVLKGRTTSKRIKIWGDNGGQCRPYVSAFPPKTEWILAISKLPREQSQQSPQEDYFISVCGEYWARVENGTVSGRLTSPRPPEVNDKPEKMSLAELRARL